MFPLLFGWPKSKLFPSTYAAVKKHSKRLENGPWMKIYLRCKIVCVFFMWNHLFIFECLDTLWCFSKYVLFGNRIDIFDAFDWSCRLRHPLFKHPTLEHDKMMVFNRYVEVTIGQIEFARLTYMLYSLAFGWKCQFDLILYKFFLDARYNKKPLQSQLPSKKTLQYPLEV